MATNFPTSLDSWIAKVDGTDYPQAAHINNLQDAVNALETKVGANSSGVTTTLDYKVAQLESTRALKTITLTASTGLSGGGDLSANRSFSLANTAVTPGTYGSTSTIGKFTVDQQGRLTSASSETPSGTWGISVSQGAAYVNVIASGASAVKTGRDTWANAAYTYTTRSDPNAPTTYACAIGFGGGGPAGCAEIMANWNGGAGGGLWYRSLRDTTDNWTAWTRVLDAANYTDYTVTKTGSGASGTWEISITGNAATATTANNGGVTSVNGTTGAITLSSLTDFTKSLGSSGYQKFPGGLMIQWGAVGTSIAGQGTGSVTFPTAFSTALVNVQITPRGNNSATSDQGTIDVYSEGTSGFNYKNNGDAAVAGMFWMALGY